MSTLPSDRLNESLKRLHDFDNEARVYRERAIYARSIVDQSIVERYVKREISLIFDVQIVKEIDIVGRGLGGSPSPPSMNGSTLILQFDALDGCKREERNQEPMLVPLVENVNGPNGKIPSVVRLYFINDEPIKPLTGRVYYSPAQRSFKSIVSGIDGKFGMFSNGRGDKFRDGFDPRIIQSAIEVVSGVPNQQCNINPQFSIGHIMLDSFI